MRDLSRRGQLAQQVFEARRTGRLAQPFNHPMARLARPGWAHRTYYNFFRKHRDLFRKVAPGWFEIIDEP